MSAVALAARARKDAAPLKPFPLLAQPDGQRREYFEALRKYVARAAALLRARLEPVLARMAKAREDSRLRWDAAGEDEVLRAIESAAAALLREVPAGDLAAMAEHSAYEVSAFQRGQLRQAFRDTLAIDLEDILREEPYLRARVRDFTRENVSLVRSISSDYFAQVEQVLMKGVREGRRPEVLAKLLAERTGVAESRAALVARDQVGKFYGALNVERQQALGVTRFRWRDMGDNRVREKHRALSGQVFSFDKLPAEGYPGRPINCRCWAEPLLDDLLNAPARPRAEEPEAPRAPRMPTPVQTRAPATPLGALPLRAAAMRAARKVSPKKAAPLAVKRALAAPKKRRDWTSTREYLVAVEELNDVQVKEWEPGRVPPIEEAIDEGRFLTLPPIRVVTDPRTGLREVSYGNHRLSVARRRGEKFIKVRFMDRAASDVLPERAMGAPSFPDVHAR